MQYAWYMTNNRDYRFESFDYAKENGFKVSDYDLAQSGTIDDPEVLAHPDWHILDYLYSQMNRSQSNHPGIRSMSVSDIVILSDDDGWNLRVYYCDDCGWTGLDFWKDF